MSRFIGSSGILPVCKNAVNSYTIRYILLSDTGIRRYNCDCERKKMAVAQKTILLVEDEVLVAASQKLTLEEYGFAVIPANSGAQAIESIKRNPSIDMVLMDIDLGPGKPDGTGTAEKILTLRDLPIIFCTNHAEKEMVDQVRGIARYGYVLKYAGEFVLIESINMAFELFETQSQLKKENARKESAERAANEQLKNIRFLADTAVQFIDTAVDRNIYRYIGECLHTLVPEAYITVNSVNQNEGILTTEALLGVGNRYDKLISILGINPVGNTYRVDSSIFELAGGKLEEFSGGLHELTFGGIPKRVCSALESFFQIGSIYGMAFMVDRQIYATSTFLMKKGNTVKNSETIEAFVRQATIALKRQKIEEDLRNSRQELQNLLREKELLLQETHHRIKNNMNMIHSLLSIQSRSLEDKNSRNILNDAAGRLQTMMLLYEQLYRSENYRELNANDFIPPLVQRIADSFPPRPGINCSVEVENLKIKPKVMTPLGIIITELITNSMKHAFNETPEGQIRVKVSKGSDSSLRLVYRDNGSGLPEHTKKEKGSGLGLKLIDALVRQLDGSLEIENKRGVKITITCKAG